MTAEITPSGKISKKEFLKSSRDAALASLGLLIPELLQDAGMVDWGDNQGMASFVIALLLFFSNRFFNALRV